MLVCYAPPSASRSCARTSPSWRATFFVASQAHSIVGGIAKLSARTLVLDGEVAIYDDHLRSRFEWLREPDPAAVATPPLFMAFDLLETGRFRKLNWLAAAVRCGTVNRAWRDISLRSSSGAHSELGHFDLSHIRS